ncbi:hypothetical protein AMTR_s00019p00181920 [Amborella trichopoda]|uniref:Receptor ligand binding region domain-containing protein n=1 Tax=Amborella trichopoda TaxID=13333 RepID=W1PGZ0_AMBTC|nr:hypothetical protein AMTR_s00019p00181920 [Amborella trichopoda]
MARVLLLNVFLVFLTLAKGEERDVIKVGVVLDMDSWVGRVSNMCISMAIQDFYKKHPNFNTTILLSSRDSGGDVVQAASAGTLPISSMCVVLAQV